MQSRNLLPGQFMIFNAGLKNETLADFWIEFHGLLGITVRVLEEILIFIEFVTDKLFVFGLDQLNILQHGGAASMRIEIVNDRICGAGQRVNGNRVSSVEVETNSGLELPLGAV
jgi:hypothetical protein